MDIEQAEEATRTVAVHRRTIPMSGIRDFYDTAYGAVLAALDAAGSAPGGPAIGWYHGMPAETATVSAGFPVDGLPVGALDDRVEVVERPGGTVLTAVHAGSYDTLADGWMSLMGRLNDDGRQARGDFWEEYLTEPTPDMDPADLRTRLVLPVLSLIHI